MLNRYLMRALALVCLSCASIASAEQLEPLVDIQSGRPFAFIVKQEVGASGATPTPAGQSRALANPAQVARDFVTANLTALGVTNFPRDFTALPMQSDAHGHRQQYLQVIRGVPVLGAELSIHMKPSGEVTYVKTRLVDGFPASVTPDLSSADAELLALHLGHAEAAEAEIKTFPATLIIFPLGLLLNTADTDPHLAWLVDAVNADERDGTWGHTYCFDAHTGEQLYDRPGFIQQEHIPIHRRVGNCAAEAGIRRRIDGWRQHAWCHNVLPPISIPGECSFDDVPSLVSPPYVFGRSEGKPARGPFPPVPPGISVPSWLPAYYGTTDVDKAYDIFGALHEYYSNTFNIDGPNGHGGTAPRTTGDDNPTGTIPPPNHFQLIQQGITRVYTYVDYSGGVPGICINTGSSDPHFYGCPGGGQFFYSDGSINMCANNVVPDGCGHEYNHAVVCFSYPQLTPPIGGPANAAQPQALTEGTADFMGEVFEKSYTGTTDWLDRGGSPYWPPLRDLRTPGSIVNHLTGLPFPDRFYSSGVSCSGNSAIWAYTNLTIVSHAMYLISEGGELNGCEIQAQGIDVAQQVLFRGWRSYFSYYVTLNEACADLIQACNDLYPPDVAAEVTKALQAVELNQPGRCSGIAESAPPCAVNNAGTITSVRSDLSPTSVYTLNEAIWATGVGGVAGATIDLNLVVQEASRVTWSGFTPIGQTATVVNGDGTFASLVAIASAIGTFDIIADGNRDGYYQPWADSLVTITVENPPDGSCCGPDGTCTVTMQANCTGAWTVGGVCTPNPCAQLGSCCALDGACAVTQQDTCTGSWTLAEACTPNPCTQPTGSCCALDGTCAVTQQDTCTGSWTAAAVCTPNPCPQPGACCVGTTCTIGLQSSCQGDWLSGVTVCTPNPCGPIGACCFHDLTCAILTWDQCASQGGVAYMGDGTFCDPAPCTTAGVSESGLSMVTALRCAPNPFIGTTTLYLAGPPTAAALVSIFDAAGRLVRIAWDGAPDGREVTIIWDGRDESGHEVPSGIYLVRVESTAGGTVGRVAKVQ